MVELITFLILLVIGVIIGTLSSLIGIGGGSLIVPTLILLGFSAQNAIGTSLVAVFAISISSSYVYIKQNQISIHLGILTAFVTIPGALIGAFVTGYLSSNTLELFFGIFLLLIAIRMISKIISRNKLSYTDNVSLKGNSINILKKNFLLVIPILFGSGIIAGLFGVGGGIIVVPVFVLMLGLTMHNAVATSLFIMVFTAFTGLIAHAALGNIIIDYTIPLIIGVILGSQIGSRLIVKIRGITLGLIFAIMMLIVSGYIIINSGII